MAIIDIDGLGNKQQHTEIDVVVYLPITFHPNS
jgi:hypothetical protein